MWRLDLLPYTAGMARGSLLLPHHPVRDDLWAVTTPLKDQPMSRTKLKLRMLTPGKPSMKLLAGAWFVVLILLTACGRGDSGGSSGGSGSKPGAPANLLVTWFPEEADSLRVTWDPVAAADSYTLYQGDSDSVS